MEMVDFCTYDYRCFKVREKSLNDIGHQFTEADVFFGQFFLPYSIVNCCRGRALVINLQETFIVDSLLE